MNKMFVRIIISGILIILPFFIPIYHPAFDISTVIGVVSLIFAILTGFFIATATNNYLRLQSLTAEESSSLIKIFRLTKVIQPSAIPKMRKVIDHYAIDSIDFELINYVEKTEAQFNDILLTVDKIFPQDVKGTQLIGRIYEEIGRITSARQESALVTKRVITWTHWIVLTMLALLLIILLIMMRDGSVIFSLMVGLISFSIFNTFVLLYKIDGNQFLEELLEYQDAQRIFKAIGTMAYYPYSAIKNKYVKEPNEDYRVGVFKDYPNSLEKEVKVIKKSL